MPIFEYTAKNKSGNKVSGRVEAPDRRGALSAIEKLGVLPLKVSQKNTSSASVTHNTARKFRLSRPNHMSGREVLLFTNELCDLLEGGMTLGNALNCLASRNDANSGASAIIASLRDSIIEGANFSDALEKHPKIFSAIYINMIRAGEASGAMTEVLHRLIEHYERIQAMRAKVISAMVYPVIVLVMAFIVAIVAVTVILPKFQVIFDQIGPDGLPPMTKILVGSSNWLKQYGFLLVIFMVGGGIGFWKWTQSSSGRPIWDKWKLKMPLIKGIVASSIYANFARTLQSLLANGVPVLGALKITAQTVGNTVIGEELLKARDRVTDGTSISGPLAAGGIFPQMVIDMIAIGERTGDMPSALGHVAKRYESELERNVGIFTTALEPIMIFVVALIIAFIAISVMQAVMAVTSAAHLT